MNNNDPAVGLTVGRLVWIDALGDHFRTVVTARRQSRAGRAAALNRNPPVRFLVFGHGQRYRNQAIG
jgi:hypothetical protein